MKLLGGHCFDIKKMDVLCNRWECKGCKQIFTRNENLIRHLKDERCTGGKIKIICSDGKFKHILNTSQKVFYGGDTKFSYTTCQWIEAQAIETGKHIHHKMCGDGGERMVTVWFLNDKDDSLDKIVRPEMKQAYEADKKNWLATDKFSERTTGLFKPEFVDTRGVWLTAKCYLVQNEALNENKYSCKGVSQKHNDLHFQRYKNVLDVFLKTRRGSELEEKGIDNAKNVCL